MTDEGDDRPRLEFHHEAEKSLADFTREYTQRVANRAHQMALEEDADEVQRGHVTRAVRAYERDLQERSVVRGRIRDGLEVVGALVAGAALGTLMAAPTMATIADNTWPIAFLAVAAIVSAIGVMMKV